MNIYKKAAILVIVISFISGCASNKMVNDICDDHGISFSCERKADSEVKKVLDDFSQGSRESEARRRKSLDDRHLPDKKHDKNDTANGVINSIAQLVVRLFDED